MFVCIVHLFRDIFIFLYFHNVWHWSWQIKVSLMRRLFWSLVFRSRLQRLSMTCWHRTAAGVLQLGWLTLQWCRSWDIWSTWDTFRSTAASTQSPTSLSASDLPSVSRNLPRICPCGCLYVGVKKPRIPKARAPWHGTFPWENFSLETESLK